MSVYFLWIVGQIIYIGTNNDHIPKILFIYLIADILVMIDLRGVFIE